jgi:trehalose 6-phosphate synthase
MPDRVPRKRGVAQHRLSAEEATDTLAARGLIVVSNRQPYAHNYDGEEVTVDEALGGLTSGLDPFLQDAGGTWIAWGDGNADRNVVDEDDAVRVPPSDPAYRLRRVWLSRGDVLGYYYGFSNRILWPVCHATIGNMHAEQPYWERYRSVNETFADVVVDELDAMDDPIVWFQDYHLALAPRMARDDAPDSGVFAHFWHIPWPSWDVFRACPHRRTLLDGLLGNDLVGFHVERYRRNFLECVDRTLDGATVDREHGVVHYGGEVTTTRACPLGIDVDQVVEQREAAREKNVWESFAMRNGIDPDVTVALGVDRLDYTKGIPERLRALERFLAHHPEWRERLTYVQKGTESRSRIPEYEALQREVQSEIDRINQRFGTDDWTPVVYTTEWLCPEEMFGLYRRADLALVTPVRDGLNLVAAEYVAAQVDDPGVLVLSDQTGIHERLGREALSVTPYDIDGFTEAIATALEMPADERRARMRSLQDRVAADSLANWVSAFVEAATEMEYGPARVGSGRP